MNSTSDSLLKSMILFGGVYNYNSHLTLLHSHQLLQTDDLEGRIHAHRSKDRQHKAAFIYFIVPGKSLACQLETLLINQLPSLGFRLTNVADGRHRNFGSAMVSLGSATVCT